MVIDWSKIRKNKNKYKNQKTIIDGIKFDSKKEANYYVYLRAQGGNVALLSRIHQCCPGRL